MRRTLLTVTAMATVALAGWTPKAWAQSQPYEDDEMEDTRAGQGTRPMTPEAQQQEAMRQQQEAMRQQQESMRQQQQQQQESLRQQQQYGTQPPAPYGQQPQPQYGAQPPAPYGQQPQPQYGAQPPAPYGQQPPTYGQPYGQPPPATTAAPVVVSTTETKKKPGFSKYQVALSVGGGVSNFIRDRLSDRASIQGAWDARITIGTRFPFGVEIGYLGTAGQADAPVNEPLLSTTQVFGVGRLNLTSWRIQPFLTAGAGWAYLWREGDAGESPVAATTFNKSANAVVVPMGGGIATYLGEHAMVDARFDYRLIADKDFTNRGARPDMWVVELRGGYAF